MAYRYKTVKRDGKTALLHRLIMSELLGRALSAGEHVHHRNGNTHDNSAGNLEVLDAARHQAMHKSKHPRVKACSLCGAPFVPAPTKRKRAKACGPYCARRLAWATRRARSAPVVEALVRANVREGALACAGGAA